MTREEQIKNRIEEINDLRQSCNGRMKTGGWYYGNWFREGVKWADEHPNWHKYPDEKPVSGNDEYPYIVAYIACNITFVSEGLYYQDTDKWYDTLGRDVEPPYEAQELNVMAWMELPKFTK